MTNSIYTKRMLLAHMRAAEAYSLASYAKRLQVGAVVVDPDHDQPVCLGWNGTKSGEENVCEVEVNGELVSKDDVVHAEMNALKRLPYSGYHYHMFVTDSPCLNCSETIVATKRLTTIFFKRRYRLDDGIKHLLSNGIKLFHIKSDEEIVLLKLRNGVVEEQPAVWNNKGRLVIY